MEKKELQSYANQIEWCRESKQYLIELNHKLYSLSMEYQTNLNELRNKGCVENVLSIVEQMNREFQESSSDLIGHVNNEHLGYIETQSVGLNGDLEEFLNRY